MKDRYDRAMTFCRAQEFYESPNKNFKGKAFSIWDYIKWYSLQGGKGFSYGVDWSGFNIPVRTIKQCYQTLRKKYGPEELNIYDKTLLEIVGEVESMVNSNKDIEKCYLIGTDEGINETFKHEVCHGLFSTNKGYKTKAKALVKFLKDNDKKTYEILKQNLLKMGYSEKLIDDEIQAYLQFGVHEKEFSLGLSLKSKQELNKKYKEALYNAFQKK
jgi:hypothetical protein